MSLEIINFLSMGGYALYVWPAYVIVVVVLVGNLVTSIWKRKEK
jgi:heme exporter protein D